MKQVIGVCGPEGAGKSTVGKILVEHYGAGVVPFAQPLKKMLEALGVPPRNLYGSLEDKLEPLDVLCGRSARWAAQSLGTEWGRDLIGGDIWVNAWKSAVDAAAEHLIVADDLRFLNEVEAVRALGGHVVCVLRPEADDREGQPAHRSQEYWKLPRAYTLVNDGDMGGLCKSVCFMMEGLTNVSKIAS
jgi:hypothetical protein